VARVDASHSILMEGGEFMESATLERLQQLPAEEEAEYMECTLTCTYSCWASAPQMPCDVTGFIR
jgi:hypothetical protein